MNYINFKKIAQIIFWGLLLEIRYKKLNTRLEDFREEVRREAEYF